MINSELYFALEETLPKFSKDFQKKILHSVDLLRKAEKLALAYDQENGFYLSFSGGKDSQCLYHIAKMAGVRFKTHMGLTSVDPPEVIRFVRKQYPDVDMIKPSISIYNKAVNEGVLPTRLMRWCCRVYKEGIGQGKCVLIGIRHAESRNRASRNEVEISNHKYSGDLEGLDSFREKRNSQKRGRPTKGGVHEINITNAVDEHTIGCIRGYESLLISPIIEWTDEEVWTFLNTLGIEHCKLYDEGYHRIGCLCCPMHSYEQKMADCKRYPHIYDSWIRAIKKIQATRGNYKKMSPEDTFDWWISGKSMENWKAARKQQTLNFKD